MYLTEMQKRIVKVLVQNPRINKMMLSIFLSESEYNINFDLKWLIQQSVISMYEKKYYVNEEFLRENPIFCLKEKEEKILNLIFQNPKIEQKTLAKLMSTNEFEIEEYIKKLLHYDLVIVNHNKNVVILDIAPIFIEISLDLLPEEEQKLLFILAEYPGLGLDELTIIMRKPERDVSVLIQKFVDYHIIDSEIFDGTEKWSIIKKEQLTLNIKRLTIKDIVIIKEIYSKLKQIQEGYNCVSPCKISKKEKEILKKVIENPGLSNKELAGILQMEPNALSNKIRILARQYFIQKITIGRGVYYYINQKIKEDYQDELDETVALEKLKKEQLAMIEDVDYDENHKITEREKKILQKVIENPGLSHEELASTLQMKQTALSNKVQILAKHHLIRVVYLGRNHYYINKDFEENGKDALREKSVETAIKKRNRVGEKEVYPSTLLKIPFFYDSIIS